MRAPTKAARFTSRHAREIYGISHFASELHSVIDRVRDDRASSFLSQKCRARKTPRGGARRIEILFDSARAQFEKDPRVEVFGK